MPYQKWHQAEDDMLKAWLKENPGVPYTEGAKELAEILDDREVNKIRVRLGKFGKEMYGKRTTGPPAGRPSAKSVQRTAKRIATAKSHQAMTAREKKYPLSVMLKDMADDLDSDAELLASRAKDLRRLADDWEVLETFANTTLDIRRKLAIQVDKNGVVHRVKREDE